MISETEQQRHLVDLEFLKTTLQQADVDTELCRATEEVPVSFLIGDLPVEFKSPEAEFNLIYVPADDLLEDIALLQISILMIEPFDAQQIDATPLISKINQFMMIGAYHVNDDKQLVFRYTYALPRFDAPNEEVFLEIMRICFENFGSMARLVLQYTTGEISKEKAMSFFTV